MPDTQPQQALLAPPSFNVDIIKTTYSRFHPTNTYFSAQHDWQENAVWTESHCQNAELGSPVQSVQELRKLACLQDFYPGGHKLLEDSYICIPMTAVDSGLELQNDDGSLMAFICTAMPKDLKELLYPSLVACLDSPDLFSIQLPSPTNENPPQPFDCLHFSWYNRYTTKGNDAPSNVHPYELHLGNSRTNVWQMLPYTSSDMEEYGQLFDGLVQAFQDVFLWIGSVLQVHLPEAEYSVLVQVAESLPGNIVSHVEPFISLVMNINVQTAAHCNHFDKNLCLALAIGDFSGGGLSAQGARAGAGLTEWRLRSFSLQQGNALQPGLCWSAGDLCHAN
ncbi:hypothetical protein PISMIDRAFT_117551 [Pisolithus microcarpus 441]|uniref:Uncharacterized protein n=1 Tax=Pisolithus microcarpus 441 TaxID=765257 RepID=A0A0C9Z298_9AGAM|nr:hypothetical protein PISMIDRAFT_117551 [Pisolithus microcarpus 441]